MSTYTRKRVLSLFGTPIGRTTLAQAESLGVIPKASRRRTGKIDVRHWDIRDLPEIGAKYGFLSPLQSSTVVTVFAAKGGVLKTTTALNLARLAALHNVPTCVIGLDLQCDVTRSLGGEITIDDSSDIKDVHLQTVKGLYDVFTGSDVTDVTVHADIPTLDLIPENAQLILLENDLAREVRREYWLEQNVIAPLRERYKLIILDCPPSWNILVANALTACDILISPLECRIMHFANFRTFQDLLARFNTKMKLHYDTVYIPTRLHVNRKLSATIRQWYLANVPGCTGTAIRESNVAEEAVSLHKSIPEHQPTGGPADEMRDLIRELWDRIQGVRAHGAIA